MERKKGGYHPKSLKESSGGEEPPCHEKKKRDNFLLAGMTEQSSGPVYSLTQGKRPHQRGESEIPLQVIHDDEKIKIRERRGAPSISYARCVQRRGTRVAKGNRPPPLGVGWGRRTPSKRPFSDVRKEKGKWFRIIMRELSFGGGVYKGPGFTTSDPRPTWRAVVVSRRGLPGWRCAGKQATQSLHKEKVPRRATKAKGKRENWVRAVRSRKGPSPLSTSHSTRRGKESR